MDGSLSLRGLKISEEIRIIHRNLERYLASFDQASTLYGKAAHGELDRKTLTNILRSLRLPSLSRATLAWITENDINSFREELYKVAVLERMQRQYDHQTMGTASAFKAFAALLSNDEDLVHWHKQFLLPFYRRVKSNKPYLYCLKPNDPTMLHFAIRLALQGCWSVLDELTDYAHQNIDKVKKTYRADYDFFDALVNGNCVGMEEAISIIIANHRWRSDDHPPYDNFVSYWAVLYGKIARIHGYTLELDDKYVPNAWLDCEKAKNAKPLDIVSDTFNAFEPLPYLGPTREGHFKEDYSSLSPRPRGESMVTFTDIWQFMEKEPYGALPGLR